MAKFNYKKWITENKHGKNPFSSLYEQGVADFEVKEQITTGSNTGSGGTTGSGTGSGGTTGSGTGSANWWCTGTGTTGPSCVQSTGQPQGSTGPYNSSQLCNSACSGGTTGSATGSGTGSSGCANISYTGECADNPGGSNNTQHNDGCSTIDGSMPTQAHVGTYATRAGSPNIWKITVIGAQNTTNNGHSYTSAGCTGGSTPTGSNNTPDPGNFQCSPNYVSGQTQANGNPLTPNQIFGMQTATQTPTSNYVTFMTDGYNQYGCQYLQNNFVKQFQKNNTLVSSFNGTSPYCDPNQTGANSAAMQQGDNPKWQGLLQSRMSWLLSFAPTGCNVTANLGTQNETFKLHENKIKIPKKITKGKLKNIIREELKNSLLKGNSLITENWNGRGCDSYVPVSHPHCNKCNNNIPVYQGSYYDINITGPHQQGCPCCRDEGRGGEQEGCLDSNYANYGKCCPPDQNNPECIPVVHNQECCGELIHTGDKKGCMSPGYTNTNECCPPSPGCVPNVPNDDCCYGERRGEPCEGWPSTWAALTPAQQGICHECPGHPDCHCCPDPTRGGGNDLNCTCCNGAYGQSYQIPSSTPGGCASLNSSTLYNCGPAGQHIDCKKPGGGEPVGTSIGESKKLRQEIQKELFGKK